MYQFSTPFAIPVSYKNENTNVKLFRLLQKRLTRHAKRHVKKLIFCRNFKYYKKKLPFINFNFEIVLYKMWCKEYILFLLSMCSMIISLSNKSSTVLLSMYNI